MKQKAIKVTLSLAFCCSLLLPVGTCLGQEVDQPKTIYNSELTQLEMNLEALANHNKMQLLELKKLKQQVETLKYQLSQSKAELYQAQNSLNNAKQSLDKLEKDLSRSKLSLGVGTGNNGFGVLLDYKSDSHFGFWGYGDKNTKTAGIKVYL